MNSFDFCQGELPLLVSFPHSGTFLPDDVAHEMTEVALSVPDTDWYLPRLYDFSVLSKCSRLQANFSRYLIDPNRPPDGTNLYSGQPTPELCPTRTFSGEAIYRDELPDAAEKLRRLEKYWQPYHDCIRAELTRLKSVFGHAVLFDAHSIASEVPRLFEGKLPDINIGTAAGTSCSDLLTDRIEKALCSQSTFSYVINGRFIGGYITRNYGDPGNGIDAVQLELSQATYMNESSSEWNDTKAKQVQPVLEKLLELFAAKVNQ